MAGPRDRGERMPDRFDEDVGRVATPPALWPKLLEAAVHARYLLGRAAAERGRPPPRIGRAAGGCLTRLLLAGVLLVIALGSAVFLFGRALLGF
ncbi:MAG: hypothetical protein ABW321_20250 [Polyangiales bacterium]